jgi:hypothetical protein
MRRYEMIRRLSLILGPALLLFLCACPGKDESQLVNDTAVSYWNYLFKGEIRSAFNMLDVSSKQTMNYSQFSKKVGFGSNTKEEIKEYWKAYYPLTGVEVKTVSVRKNSATVSLTLTIPDPQWFPDEAQLEAEKRGLKGQEYALFMIRAQTDALKQGKIPTVRISEVTSLVKEDDTWKVVFKDQG